MVNLVREKKSEERNILEYFSRLYHDFPKGKIIETESPDFIVSPGPKQRLGIEITRLTQAKVENQKFSPARGNNHENDILQEAQKIYNHKNDSVPLALSIGFKTNIEIDEEETLDIANEIADDVSNKVRHASPDSEFQFFVEDPRAGNYIDFIEGKHFPGINVSAWLNAGGFQIPDFSREYLVNRIHSKEQKLPLYRKNNLNFIWLILVTDSLQRTVSFNLFNQIEAWNLESEFDRVFLFEIVENKIYIVK